MQIDTSELEDPSVIVKLKDGTEVEARVDEFGVTVIVTNGDEIIGNGFKFFNEMKEKVNIMQSDLFKGDGAISG